MAFIVTPSQLERRADLYHQIGSFLSAGMPIIQSLEHLARNPPSRAFTHPLRQIIESLQQGRTFTEAINSTGKWMSTFDVALISAGEKSGRLDACCRLLSDYYRSQAAILKQVLRNLLYPFFLLHLALLIFPINAFTGLILQGDVAGYIKSKVIILPLYAAIVTVVYLCQGTHGEALRSTMESFLDPIPILGKARRYLALARLAAALEALINAGVLVFDAWEMASIASGSPALRRRVYSWRPELERGRTPSEMLAASREFPEFFANAYHTGEISGTQDESLRRLEVYYREEGSRKLEVLAEWIPRLVYLLVAILVAMQIIGFWAGYFNTLNNIMGP